MRLLSRFMLFIMLSYVMILPHNAYADCQYKSAGDANCNGTVALDDFEIWRREYISGCRIDLPAACGSDDNNDGLTMDADFNDVSEPTPENRKGVSIIDFEIWRRNYNTSPTNTPTPLSPTVPVVVTPTLTSSGSCLNLTGTRVTISGRQTSRYDTRSKPLLTNTLVQAETAIWQGVSDVPVNIAGGSHMCFSGGLIQGLYAMDTPWDIMHSTTAIYTTARSITIEKTRIDDYGDGIALHEGASDFTIRGVYISYNRDDCIEHDWLYTGLVEDTLLDGCYSAFSARTYSGQSNVSNGSNNIWTIQNSLIRLQPMEKVYKDRGIIPGHDGFFKWDSTGISPQLSLHNNIFRVDQETNNVGLGIPSGKLASCSNNIMVWLGKGAYPATLPTSINAQPCFTITTDKAVWDNAVNIWKKRHGY